MSNCPGGQAEQAAARTCVKEAQSLQRRQRQHLLQRPFGILDTLVIQVAQKAPPIGAETEALTRGNLAGVQRGTVR